MKSITNAKILLKDTLLEILEAEEKKQKNFKELSEGNSPPGFSPTDYQSLEDFTASAEESDVINEDDDKFLGAPTTDLPEPELKQYMQKIASRTKDVGDKYKYPYVHRSNIVDDSGNVVNPDVLRQLIKERPATILKQNKKMQKSGGDIKFFDISLPALRGIIVDEMTGDFKIVNTCPGAGACKVYCYARKGGYVQWKRASLLQTRVLNFLLNDWEGFKAKVKAEIQLVSGGKVKNFVKSGSNKYSVVIRWHDSGDFMSEKYLNVAFDIARETPNVLHYAYTKRVGMVSTATKPINFVFNFSGGAIGSEERQIDPKIHKHSIVVPKQMFSDFVHKNKETGGWDFNSPTDLNTLKDKMALKYSIKKDSIITYADLMKTPENVDTTNKWNVIVMPGNGDDAASRVDVLGTYLLIH